MKHFQPIVHTSGLVDLVGEFISELKRLEIWPEHFRQACHARGISAKDEELLEIYESYQQALREHQLFDAEGSFWSARNWLKQGQRRPFENLQFVVVDGFSDFTRTQHEILEILAGRVESLSISLTLEPQPCREDLFAKPLKTLAELRKRHPGLEVREVGERGEGRGERSEGIRVQSSGIARIALSTAYCSTQYLSPLPSPLSPSWPAMQHLERHLFGNPRQAKAAETTEGIEILAAARPIGEMEMIAARIKRLIVEEGVKPGDIAVVFRSPQDSGGLAAEVFDRFGLPVAWEHGRAARSRADPAVARRALEIGPGRLAFQFAFGRARQQLFSARLARVAKRPSGRRSRTRDPQTANPARAGNICCGSFVGQISNLSNVRSDAKIETNPRVERECSTGSKPVLDPHILERLAAAFDELPQKATLPDWAKAWEKLARQTGMLRELDLETAKKPIRASIRKSDAAGLEIASCRSFRRAIGSPAGSSSIRRSSIARKPFARWSISSAASDCPPARTNRAASACFRRRAFARCTFRISFWPAFPKRRFRSPTAKTGSTARPNICG